jgi:hypothetical protein
MNIFEIIKRKFESPEAKEIREMHEAGARVIAESLAKQQAEAEEKAKE